MDHHEESMHANQSRFKSVNYDYADYPGHHYEELPHRRISQHIFSRKSSQSTCDPQSSGDTTITELSSNFNDSTSFKRNSEFRKRVNPLYEAVSKAIPNSLENAAKDIKVQSLRHQLQRLRITVIVTILVGILIIAAALCVCLLLHFEGNAVAERLKQLERSYNSFQDKYNRLEEIFTSQKTNNSLFLLHDLYNKIEVLEENTTSLQNSLFSVSTNITKNKDDMQMKLKKLTASVTQSSNQINAKLHIISKMPGPQGPPGVGNLTACIHKTYRMHSRQDVLSTVWAPGEELLSNYTVMAASCGSDGISSYLEKKISQYRCICKGLRAMEQTCSCDIWLCPLLS